MMGVAFVEHDIVLIGCNPGAQGFDGKIGTESVFVRFRAAVMSACDGPAIDFVTTGHDAVIAGRGDDLCIFGGQGHVGFRNVIWCRHGSVSLSLQVVVAAKDQSEDADRINIVAIQLQQHLRQALIGLAGNQNAVAGQIVG